MKSSSLFIVALFIVLAVGCKDNAAAPGNIDFSYQTSACLHSGLAKTTGDSVFTYSFTSGLTIDFSIIATCSSDTARFVLTNTVGTDTIEVTVQDNAVNLARCICQFMARAEWTSLPKDRYIVKVVYTNRQGAHDVIHLAQVRKQL